MVPVVKNLPANAGDVGNTGWIPGLGRSSGVGNGNPLQYSYHGQRSLESYGPWGCKELDITEHKHTHCELITALKLTNVSVTSQLSLCACVCVCVCSENT